MKRQDAIIDDLRRVREDIGKAHDFDVRPIATTIRQHEDGSPQGIIRESPNRTTRQKKSFNPPTGPPRDPPLSVAKSRSGSN